MSFRPRRFRQVIDLFIEEYVDDRTARSEKTKLVRTVVKIVYESGYRFLKPDEEGVFAELGLKYVLKKVGGWVGSTLLMNYVAHKSVSK